MPYDAKLSDILNATVTDVTGLGLALGAVTVPVVKRKGAKREPGVDQSTQITVCKAEEKERVRYIAFGKVSVNYPVEITIISPNPADWATNLDTYLAWREQIRGLFQPPAFLGTQLWRTPGVWEIRVDTDKFLDRAAMANRYDEMTLLLRVEATS